MRTIWLTFCSIGRSKEVRLQQKISCFKAVRKTKNVQAEIKAKDLLCQVENLRCTRLHLWVDAAAMAATWLIYRVSEYKIGEDTVGKLNIASSRTWLHQTVWLMPEAWCKVVHQPSEAARYKVLRLVLIRYDYSYLSQLEVSLGRSEVEKISLHHWTAPIGIEPIVKDSPNT